MLNGLLVGGGGWSEVVFSLYLVPALSIFRFANVATPFAAFTGALPVNVPPAGLLSMAIATAPVKLVTVFPDASRADRKSTRLNSSHARIAFAGFCFKKSVAGAGCPAFFF